MKVTGKQIFDGIGFAVGVAGVVLSFYFFYAQKEFKALSFVVDPKRALLISPKQLPAARVTLLDQGGKQITGDVYSAELYLWNSGTETINKQDVIVPLIVDIPQGARLLALQPINVSRKRVTQASAIIQELANGDAIQFEFQVLEPGDGISASILYEGEEDAEFSLQGGVSGIREITDSKQIVQQQRWLAPWKENMPLFLDLGRTFLAGTALILVAFLWRLLSQRFFRRRAIILRNTVMAIIFGLFVFYLGLGSILSFIETWRHPERIIRANIRDYIPSELTKR